MSAATKAAAVINAIGAGTADDVLPRMPGYTRAQVRGALRAATVAGLIDSDGRQRNPNRPHRATGRPRGSLPTMYRQIRKEPERPRVSSVWQLGAQA